MRVIAAVCTALFLLFAVLLLKPGPEDPAPWSGSHSPDAVQPGTPSLEVMAGQMILCGFRGTGEETGEEAREELKVLFEDVAAGRLGGVIYFTVDALTREKGRNITSLEQAARLSAGLQKKARVPLFISVDQEGGRVRRFTEEHGVPATPSARVLGWGEPEATRAEAWSLGLFLRQAGVNLNFAPSLDVDSNPDSPAIGALGRSFGADPASVAAHGLAFAEGMRDAGLIACYKHFPGHGSATEDSHRGLTDISATWDASELAPYREVLPQSPPAMVMLGHMVHRGMAGELPASLSPAVVALLRKDLGWQGVICTDDMQMRAVEDMYSPEEAIALAVEAGVDILLLGNNLRHDPLTARKAHAALMELVTSGRVPEERIRESYERIMKLKREAGLLSISPN